MPLRHGNGPAPAWAAGCAGPFLVVMCALGLVGFLFEGVNDFQDGAAVIAMIILGGAGLWLSIDYFGGLLRKRGK